VSAEDLINKSLTPPADEVAPRGEPRAMSDAYAAAEEKRKEYHGDDSSAAAAAARDLTKAREAGGIPQAEDEPRTRQYINYETNERMPLEETVSLERASDDLTRQRSFERQQVEDVQKELLKFSVDAVRAGHDPQELLQQHAQQQEQSQQPEAQAQPDQIQPQPVSELPPEVAELAAELEKSPRLKAALQEEAVRIQQAQQGAVQAQQAFAQATQQAEAFAVQTLMASYPELQGLSVQQLPAALQVLRANNPQRYSDAVAHLARVDQLARANQQVQAQQQAQTQAVTQQWIQQQDQEVDRYLAQHESKQTVEAVKSNILPVIKSYGIDENDFRQAIANVPMLRSAPFQKMLFSLVKTHTLRESAAEKVSRPVPPVMRPGTARPHGSYAEGEIAAARARMLANPDDMKAAAAYVVAKRMARD
jgi:hypothetical protein